MIDLHAALQTLATERPVFHSEADFQHALAWHLRSNLPRLAVRLEYRPQQLAQRGYVDVWVTNGKQIAAIELKYKNRVLQVFVNGELLGATAVHDSF